MPIAEKNKKKLNAMDTYAEVARYVESKAGFVRCSPAHLTDMMLALMLASIFLMIYEITKVVPAKS